VVLLGNRSEIIKPIGENDDVLYENESSGTQYVAFSVRLEEQWQAPTWGIVLQLHGPASLGVHPSFHVELNDHFSIYLHAGDLDGTHIENTEYLLSDGSIHPGAWTDFVLKIKFSKSYTGSVDVWRREEGEADFTSILSLADVPTLQYKSSLGPNAGDHYWQHGFYRQAEYFTNILWLDCFTRGSDFDAVVAKAWPES